MRSFRRFPKQPPIFARTLSPPAGGGAAGGGGGMWRAPLVAFSATVLLVIVLASGELLGGGGGGGTLRRFALPPTAPAPAAAAAAAGVPPPFTLDSPELEGGRIDFCPALTRPPPPTAAGGDEEGDEAQRDGGGGVRGQAHSVFNLVAPAASGDAAPCDFWTSLRYPTLLPAPIPLCVHDPAVDGGVSAHIVANGGFMTRLQLSLLLAAAPCTPSQPYFIDAGANVGSWGMLAAVAAGCHVLAFEPLAANVAALRASAAANNVSHRFTVFRNALGAAPGRAAIEVSYGNSGANRLAAWGHLPPEGGGEQPAAAPDDGALAYAPVDVATLDDLFFPPPQPAAAAAAGAPPDALAAWRAALPVPLTPGAVAGAKVDAEGHDAAALHGGARALLHGSLPLLFIEYEPRDVLAVSGCDPRRLMRALWGEAAGYAPGARPRGGWNVVLDAWSGLPLPPPCDGSDMAARLAGLDAYAAARGEDAQGNPLDSGWPQAWDELLVVWRHAPFLPALLAHAATRVGNNTPAAVAAPLTACGEPPPRGLAGGA